MITDAWLNKHPYLHGIANLQKLVETTAAELVTPSTCVPQWSDYVADFDFGVPLLLSSLVTIDLRSAEYSFKSFMETLNSKTLPDRLAQEIRTVMVDLQNDPSLPRKIIASLLDNDTSALKHPGLLRYLGWTFMARHLRQLMLAFGQWREEERWLLNYCPLCGAPPTMAQLVGSDPARVRLLSCGCCRTRWRFRRSWCPFCNSDDDRCISVLAIEGENTLRIDHCDSCRGYLKTYIGEGDEALLLSDWSSLHLDLIAQDRGLMRFAGSLYEF
jgi:FdhE protein